MALDALGGDDPCSKLNNVQDTGFPNLWISPTSTSGLSEVEVSYIVEALGKTRSLKSYISNSNFSLTKALLKNPAPSSSFRLLKYMSGSATQAMTLGTVILPNKKTLVDDYFVGENSNYLNLFGQTLTPTQPSDIENSKITQ